MPSRVRSAAFALSLGLMLVGCSDGGDGAPAATEAPVDIQALLARADPNQGEVLFLQCRACHTLEAGGANRVGPNLHGVFGRKAGMAPGYLYSEVLSQANIVWSAKTVDRWLARPSEFLPGNRMVFVGIRVAEDRANLIAYLQRETGAK